MLQYVAGLLDSLRCQFAANAQGDGDITALGALVILQYVAGLLNELLV